MISFDFEFYQASTIDHAINLFQQVKSAEKKAMFYGGGTEFISRARRNEIDVDVVIDLKKIPECNAFDRENDELIIGSTITLNKIADEKIFPLLGDVCKEIATRTERNKITIGGNLVSNLPYKEGLLALLVSDSELLIAGPEGMKRRNIHDISEPGLDLKEGEFIVQIIVKKDTLQYPYFHFRRTTQSRINYPIISMVCLLIDGKMRFAFSGLSPFPFRSAQIEKILNDFDIPLKERFNKIVHLIPSNIMDDFSASQAYRLFVLEKALEETIDGAGVVS